MLRVSSAWGMSLSQRLSGKLGGAAQARNEMVFKYLDGSFGVVAAVEACWGKLKTNFLYFHILLQNL